ncbi:nuclear transport factor 2 family protein [Sinomonas sp. B1-1]|uniref:nuclear transport factor 2 family protein n=1 Tax=Sinomonas sp. B1-1 TaxID=3141454 RepID=UPI003D286E90
MGYAPPTVESLYAIESIKQLKARYFRYVDLKKWELLHGLFTETARFEGLWAAGDGVDAFISNISRNLAGVFTAHHGYMPEIRLEAPERASGIWAMSDRLEWEADTRAYLGVSIPGQRGIHGYGYYEEEYLLTDGEWKIDFLRLTRLHIEPITSAPPPKLSGWLEPEMAR